MCVHDVIFKYFYLSSNIHIKPISKPMKGHTSTHMSMKVGVHVGYVLCVCSQPISLVWEILWDFHLNYYNQFLWLPVSSCIEWWSAYHIFLTWLTEKRPWAQKRDLPILLSEFTWLASGKRNPVLDRYRNKALAVWDTLLLVPKYDSSIMYLSVSLNYKQEIWMERTGPQPKGRLSFTDVVVIYNLIITEVTEYFN